MPLCNDATGSNTTEAERSHLSSQGAVEGFTRLELLVTLAGAGLLLALALPAFASNRERSLRLLCVNNLRQAGQALREWGVDHNGRVPWRTSFCEGGTLPFRAGFSSEPSPPWLVSAANRNIWFQWGWLSNELHTPKVLACPADDAKRPASMWNASPAGGFFEPSYRNNAVSYLIGLDATPPDRILDLLAGDRNVRFSLAHQGCSSGINDVPGSPHSRLTLPSSPACTSSEATTCLRMGASRKCRARGS